MKVLFVLKDLKMCERLGIMYLSAVAKQAGHQTDLIATDLEDIHKKMKEYQPDILAYSLHTGEHPQIITFNNNLKKRYNFLSIFGGPHPTFFPEMIDSNGVDVIVIGEGEEAFVDLLNALQKKESINNIKNLWIKQADGSVIKNPPRPLLQNLDELPLPDRELIYNYDKSLFDEGEKRIISGRGCPFMCTYCFNKQMVDIYGKDWSKVRKRSVDNIIEEVLMIKEKYPLEFIKFNDDTFIMADIKWLQELAEKWPKKIGIPWFCNVRANLVTPEVARLLKKGGCVSTFLAIESGNDEVRNGILKRYMSKDQIRNACKYLREEGIKYGFYNILGLPVENKFEVDMETLLFNIELKPTMAWSSLLTPYPRTWLGEYAKQHGYFDGDYDMIRANNKIESAITFKNKKEKRLVENLHKFFGITVSYPWLLPLTKQLIKLPQNKLFMYILMGWYGYTLKMRMSPIKVTPKRFLRWILAVRKHVNDY
ncbi:MAG: B12-binding domain-containing radical SAM protein [Nanoarchaeota archaeon]|nr:B12-binding domain-containing radical SAM protein [Nanoarchaeota archaeon]